ncbi:aromatic ring-hydroxylating oxygenase subunit alpha [Bacillus aerolatus]|uniref:aromatic ring-hydroxylating oxygenase subunit alpha n=1 Tax=Bacillus aerolatus TaxID=2653354 RepID=UPI0038512AE8
MLVKDSVNKQTLQKLKEKLDKGLMPQWAVTDKDIYELERRQIFGKTWQFLGHESELKEPGSYVTRWIASDPVLLVKTNSGEIKAYLNSCTHRGAHLCTADFGKKKTFTCPYHGWSFNLEGELVGVVSGKKVYGEKMIKDEWGLRPIPKVGMYQGLIFASLDHQAMPLEDYLGDMKWYLDILLGRSDGGMEVRGVPQRWTAQANWKMTQENFASDPYHVQTNHRSTVELGISPNDPNFASYGHQIVLGNGHGLSIMTSATGKSPYKYQTLPESMWPMFERNLSPEQNEIFSNATVFVGGMFPNLAFDSPVHGMEGEMCNYLNLRVWRPLGPDKVEIWCWFLIDKAAPEEYKEEAYKAYVGSFGPSGTLEQDDTEVWARIIQVSDALMMEDKELSYNNVNNYLLGEDVFEPVENFPGPGVAYPSTYTDNLARSIQKRWFELISKGLLDEEEDSQ